MKLRHPTRWPSWGPLALLLALLSPTLGWADDDRDASCSISPDNPSINTGGSVNWSVGTRSGFPSNGTWRYSWSFQGGSPSSSTSSSRTVRYANAGTFTTSLTLRRGERARATCSTTVTVGTSDNQAPSTPNNLSATPVSASQIDLAWNASSDNVGVTDYRVYRCSGSSSCTPTSQVGTSPTNSYSDTGLVANTLYRYRVRAEDTAGNLSSYSSTASATTLQQSQQTCSISVNPTPLAFGNVNVASSASRSTTVTNTGTGACALTVARSGTNEFALTSAASLNIPVGGTATVSATYTPNGTGADSGNLAISGSGISTVNVGLAGTGVVQQSQCSPTNAMPSINSTSQSGCPDATVPQQSTVSSNSYSVLAINDLGMHCGDLDTRIASILPPFNVLHAQVVQKGAEPTLNPGGVSVLYSATSNPNDPILAQGAAAFTGVMGDGSTYKTNFWDTLNAGAYNAFYPFDIAPFIPGDVGLPVPDSALLPSIVPDQQSMPGVDGAYTNNDPQGFTRFDSDIQFFTSFPFGYTAAVDWFAADGIPVAAFDDFGRENPYPLMRVQAKQGSTVLATVDTVTPISGEANCQNCHAAPADGGNGTATTEAGIASPAVSLDDPSFGDMPIGVSVEWAADHNILKLHDILNGTSLITGTDQDFPTAGTTPFEPVVCQRCHYTPALDLAQVGPNDVNGREQSNSQTMSRVMHKHHGDTGLFPTIPAPIQAADGTITNQAQRVTALEESCYQCHPGKNTQCLRGAMFNADMLCSDCHGNMSQVGNDFSKNMPGGSFIVAGDFYTNPNTPRVPWANEPGCGSCHTGDASSNLAGTSGTVVNNRDANGYKDGLRLRVAYKTSDTTKATPIVPTNKRFAEPVINPGANSAPGTNPKLYRVSTGHSGVMCEGCHGSTHAEWPNANPNANDNVTSTQLQGHAGVIADCSTCHGSATLSGLSGPHGLHQIAYGSTPWSSSNRHESQGENFSNCATCHGGTSRSNSCGTPLSRALANRTFSGRQVAKGQPVGCAVCHNSSYWNSTCANQ